MRILPIFTAQRFNQFRPNSFKWNERPDLAALLGYPTISFRTDSTNARDSVDVALQSFEPPSSQTKSAQSTASKQSIANVGIVGSGSSACALSAYLSNQGHAISVLARDVSRLPVMGQTREIKSSGRLEGSFPIADLTSSCEEFLENNEYIFVATVTTAYGDIASKLAKFLQPHHKVILFSSKLGGSLEVKHILTQMGKPEIPVLETDALFACRLQPDESIWIKGIKNWTLYSATQHSDTMKHAEAITRFFPGLQAATNLVQRGLTDFGALAHAPIMIANMNTIDRGTSFQFYWQGMTERTVIILEQLEQEFSQIAKAYGADLIPMKELLNRYYGCNTESLLKAMCTVPNYEHSYAPSGLNHRFLYEDVSSTLVPASQLAAKAGVQVPVLESIITFSSVLAGEDFRTTGRTLARLGMGQLTSGQIMDRISA
ncbi:MAG: NAD/NADP octopine/nopaline dehydrogenase family protein [Cyanobacteria bacterium]|nr:NAD/NADP octopine/nopaline dehydrogenase family protein [Cyanobacteriota bacterium]